MKIKYTIRELNEVRAEAMVSGNATVISLCNETIALHQLLQELSAVIRSHGIGCSDCPLEKV